MELTVYSCRGGEFLFVPKLCLPPTEARHVFSPMQLRGDVSIDEGSPSWSSIVQQIDRHLFATMSDAGARLLLGTDHACFVEHEVTSPPLASYDDAG